MDKHRLALGAGFLSLWACCGAGLSTNTSSSPAPLPAVEASTSQKCATLAAAALVPLLATVALLALHRCSAAWWGSAERAEHLRYVLCLELPPLLPADRYGAEDPAGTVCAPSGLLFAIRASLVDVHGPKVLSTLTTDAVNCDDAHFFGECCSASFDSDFASYARDYVFRKLPIPAHVQDVSPLPISVTVDIPRREASLHAGGPGCPLLTAMARIISGIAKAREMSFEGRTKRADGSVGAITLSSRDGALAAAVASISQARKRAWTSSAAFQPEYCMWQTEDMSAHMLLEVSAGVTRAVVFVCRESAEAAPMLDMMPREFSCGPVPKSGAESADAYQLLELEPLVDQVMKYVADLGLPSPTVAAVGPGSDDPLIRRVMDGKGLAMWLPGPSCNDIGLVAYGAACLAASQVVSAVQNADVKDMWNVVDVTSLLCVEPVSAVVRRLQEVARNSRRILREKVQLHSDSDGGKVGLPLAPSLHSFTSFTTKSQTTSYSNPDY